MIVVTLLKVLRKSVFTCNEVRFCLILFCFFTSVLLLYFGEVTKCKVVLEAKSALSRLVRMCLAQPGYGSGLLPLVYYRPNKLADLTVSERSGTSYQIEIHFAVVNHLYLLFSSMKLVET